MKKLSKIILITITIFLVIGCHNTNKPTKRNENPQPEDTVIKEIKDIDTNLGYNLPLGVDSVKLMSSGKVILVTTNENLPAEELTVGINVKDIYILPFGNGGYRSIIFLKNDGTVSAVNASALIENKKIEIMDNLGEYTNIVDINGQKEPDGFLITAITDTGEKLILDEYIK